MRILKSLSHPIRYLLDWALSIVFGLVFALILVVFDPIQRIAMAIGPGLHEVAITYLNRLAVCSYRLLGVRFEIEFDRQLPDEGPILIVANHQSLFDIPLLFTLFLKFTPRYIAKKELAKGLPSVSFNLTRGGNAVIDRSNRRQAVQAIEKLGKFAAERKCGVIIFPEGTRARDGVLKRFKAIGFISLVKSIDDVTIIPVAIDNSWLITERGILPFRTGIKIRVHVKDPLPSKEEPPEALLERAYEAIKSELETMRRA